MDDDSFETILGIPECFNFMVFDWLRILDFLSVRVLEPVEVNYKYFRKFVDMHLFKCHLHAITLLAVPCILLIQLLWLIEQFKAVMQCDVSAL